MTRRGRALRPGPSVVLTHVIVGAKRLTGRIAVEVEAWLNALGLGQYGPAFVANAIDADTLPQLTDGDLRELGVEALGHRKKLMAAIARLSARNPTLILGFARPPGSTPWHRIKERTRGCPK